MKKAQIRTSSAARKKQGTRDLVITEAGLAFLDAVNSALGRVSRVMVAEVVCGWCGSPDVPPIRKGDSMTLCADCVIIWHETQADYLRIL
jgi:hypothetical protein